MKNTVKNFIASILGLVFLFSIAVIINAAELKKTEGELTPPPLKLESLKGEVLDLADFKNQVVLVQFWATYCTPCRMEMPSMNKLMAKLKEEQIPFKILAVNMAETKGEIQKFVDEVKPEFTILQAQGETIQSWNVFAAPSNFLIGPKGKIRYTLYGGVEWDSEGIIEAIRSLAAEAKDEKPADKKTDEAKTDKPKSNDGKAVKTKKNEAEKKD